MKTSLILIFIPLCIFIHNNGVNAFTPPPRAEQAAILINNRIYFNGGWNGTYVSDFFYLDVSGPFTTASMNWTDLSSIPGRIMRAFSTACISEINKGQIIYFSGGAIAVGDNFTSIFDTKTQQWITPKTSGNFTAVVRKSAQCIASGNEIYIYGGYDDLFNMIKLDALNLKWSTYYPGFIAPIGLLGYSATLLNNASILYMGGKLHQGSFVDLSYILMDKTTSGSIPYSRCDHGSVYIPQYNQILIFYGYPDSSFIALDTLNFVWSYPTILNNGGSPYQLIRFTSILIGAYILIAFGNDHISDNLTNDVLLLDVSQKDNYKWSTSYDPTKRFQSISTTTPIMSPTSNISHDSLSVNIGAIIGGIFGGIAGLIILSTAAVIAIKRYGNPPLFTSEEVTSNQPES